jgi:LmbE family N-acetylglucosaminyl deacetylase
MRYPHIQSLNQHYDHIYVSPHFDDAAASCGGRISKQLHAGEKILVVTVFTGLTGHKTKPSKRILESTVAYELRREEDAQAMQRLGADFLWLEYPEFLFRSRIPMSRYWPVFRNTRVNRRLCRVLRSDLEVICQKTGCQNLIIPMAAGQHMDHQIVFEVGVDLIRQGENAFGVAFYEDYPYALLPGMLTYRMKITGMLKHDQWNHEERMKRHMKSASRDAYRLLSRIPSLKMNHYLIKPLAFLAVPIFGLIVRRLMRSKNSIVHGIRVSSQVCDISTVIEQKIDAIAAYESQLSMPLFSNRRIKEILAVYARVLGLPKNRFGERYWLVSLMK